MALIYDKLGNFKGYTPNGKGDYDYWYQNKYKLVPMNLKGIKDRKVKELSKERIKVDSIIRPIEEERVIKERFIQYNTIDNIRLRQAQFRLYYYGGNMTIEELKAEELQRMLESYNCFKASGAKGFYNWLKSYVVADYELLMELVKLTSETKQQKYKKMKSINKVFGNLAKVNKKLVKDEYIDIDQGVYKSEEQYQEELIDSQEQLRETYMIQLKGFIDGIKVDDRYREVKYKSEIRSYHRRLEADFKRKRELERMDTEARAVSAVV